MACLAGSKVNIQQSDGEAPEMLKFLGIRCTSSLPWLPGPLWRGEVTTDNDLSIGQIGLFEFNNLPESKQMADV